MTEEQFGPASREMFDRILQMTDNAWATDDHRALNYLAMRYPGIYVKAAEASIGRVSAPIIGGMISSRLVIVAPMFRVAPISPPPTPIGAERFSPIPMCGQDLRKAIGIARLTHPFFDRSGE